MQEKDNSYCLHSIYCLQNDMIIRNFVRSIIPWYLIDNFSFWCRGHIPYRDSKLTRILQPALGGNAKTSIICTAAPEEVCIVHFWVLYLPVLTSIFFVFAYSKQNYHLTCRCTLRKLEEPLNLQAEQNVSAIVPK